MALSAEQKFNDSQALIPLPRLLEENSIGPLAYFRAYLEDRAPPVIVFDGDLYVVRSDAQRWKSRLRATALHRKAETLGAGASHG